MFKIVLYHALVAYEVVEINVFMYIDKDPKNQKQHFFPVEGILEQRVKGKIVTNKNAAGKIIFPSI